MQTRKLGRNGPAVSALGLGCMGMSEFYGAHDDDESLATLRHALDLGVNFLDTADAYGPYTNEELVGRALRGRRQDAFLATKFGFVRDEHDPAARAIDARPQRVRPARAALSASRSNPSIFITCIGWIRRSRWRIPSGRWRSWCARARCATSGFRRFPR